MTPVTVPLTPGRKRGVTLPIQQSDVTGLSDSLGGKANASHTHAASAINSGVLDAARIPTLPQSKVTGLTSALSEIESRLPATITTKPYSSTPHPTAQVAVLGSADPKPGWFGQGNMVYASWDSGLISYPSNQPEPVEGTPAICRVYGTGAQNAQSLFGQSFVSGVTEFGFVIHAWPADFQIYIDGHPVSGGPWISTNPNGDVLFVHVSGLTRDEHQVHFSMGNGFLFQTLVGPPPFQARADTSRTTTVAVVGDSYADIGIMPYSLGLNGELHRLTGWNIQQLGQGSTGYTNDGGGVAGKTVYGSSVRLARLIATNPKLVIPLGSVNDGGQSVPGLTSAANSYWSAIATALPDATIIPVGIEPLRINDDMTAWNTLNAALKAAAEAHPNVAGFIDWRGEEWFSGNGTVCTPNGSGNQDFYVGAKDSNDVCVDSIHASRIGNAYLAQRLVQSIEKILQDA